jgi:hypothetical protein
MKRKSRTEFRKNIEKVLKEFGLSDKLKSVNIIQIENYRQEIYALICKERETE